APEEAARILHTLRGSIGTFGGHRLVESSLKAEQAVAAGELTALAPLVQQVERDLTAVLAELEAWAQRVGSTID
ncbi:Hpt domain-containing protein, partial [Pseudomonas sp. CrR25]|nr:Hpt domain-containing protein [Pseudomonas sp. CrR25]